MEQAKISVILIGMGYSIDQRRAWNEFSMPDSGQWNTIPINITEILGFKNLCHSNSEVKNLGMKIPTRVKTNGIC